MMSSCLSSSWWACYGQVGAVGSVFPVLSMQRNGRGLCLLRARGDDGDCGRGRNKDGKGQGKQVLQNPPNAGRFEMYGVEN